VWSKLRCNPSLRCYYEPLHEQLAALDRATVDGPADAAMVRMLRHPPQEKSYFAEYLDLVASGRLRYSRDLAYARYLLRPAQTDETLRAYLDGLIGDAAAAGRRPVLCFCRSQMRSAWMRRVFGGIHIAQVRNPFDQWASFQVNSYFIRQMLTIALALRAEHPLAFIHLDRFEQQARALARQDTTPGGERGNAPTIDWRDALGVFLVLWIASALQAIDCSDGLLDVDRLATDDGYRQESSRWLGTLGCTIDFADCKTPSAGSSPGDAALLAAMATEAAAAIRSNASTLVVADAATVAQRLMSLSASSRRVLEQALPAGRA